MHNLDIANLNAVPKIINTDDDFISIPCPDKLEHGLYYKSIHQIKRQDTECPRCQFLKSSRMFDILDDALEEIQRDITWLPAWLQNKDNQDVLETSALYYRLHLVHKTSGLEFQKIGVLSTLDDKSSGDHHKDFRTMWSPFKWKGFRIETVDLIECTLLEASTIEGMYQRDHTHLKITVPNELGFNTNKTYLPDFIWQAKSKTIKPLREAFLNKQNNRCTICDKQVKDPTLDHMHIKKVRGTGFIRAVCCSQCNTFIARSENNASRHGIRTHELPDVLRRMAQHLEEQKMIIHPTEVPKRQKVGVREWNKVKKYYLGAFPTRRSIPKKPTYVTEGWIQIKEAVDDYVLAQQRIKEENKKKKRAIA